MIIAGIVLVLLGYWLLPEFVPAFPANIDGLIGGIGVIVLVIGVILLIFSAVAGRHVGGRRWWL